MLFCVFFLAWTNNLSDYEDEGYSDVDEEESDEEFNQKTEGNTRTYRCWSVVGCFIADSHRVVFTAGRQRRGGRGASERDVTPPLLAKVQGNLEVLCQIY